MKPQQENPNQPDAVWTAGPQTVREQIHYRCESPDLSERQREVVFLRGLMQFDETNESRDLEAQLDRAEHSERCVRRAVLLMSLLTAGAIMGLGYAAVLLDDFPPTESHFVVRILCAFGLASLTSLLVFVGCWLVCRGKVNDVRDGCRRLVRRILESRLRRPVDVSMRHIVASTTPMNRLDAASIPATVSNNGPATK